MLPGNSNDVQSASDLSEKLERYLGFLEQDKNNLNLLLEISTLYSENNELNHAQNYLDKAKLLYPESCLGAQGLLNLKQGQLQQAKDDFKAALKHTPTPELYYNLAFAHYIDSEFAEAWTALSSINTNDYFPDIPLLMARILQQQDRLEQAISLLENQLIENPGDAVTLSFLSLLHFDNNNETLAAKFCNRALELNPDVYDARLVNIMLRLFEQETSVEEIEALLQINPDDSRLWFALGSTYMTQGDFSLAEQYLTKTIEIHPEFYDCYIALAWSQLLNDKIAEAHESYQNAISLEDSLADACGGLSIIYSLSADLKQTEQLIVKANSLNPDCFLTQIAEVIYLNHTSPKDAQQQLFTTLSSQKTTVSEKLALIIEGLS